MTNLTVKTAAVLGAGTMGAQLAACFANTGIKTYLFDIDKSLATTAIKNLAKIKPEPIHTKKCLDLITPVDYETLEVLNECDLVIEAIAENITLKIDLLNKISPYIKNTSWLGSNTSGLSINEIAKYLPNTVQERFLGMHFFNPPRYLPLLELIPSELTTTELTGLINFFSSNLGKEVVLAPDSPNFIANRVGLFSLLLTTRNAIKFDIPLEVADILTGTLIGRPKSATFRTADVVGLDILKNAAATSKSVIHDPWNELHTLPEFLLELINKGHLGQKTKQGIYEKRSDGIYVFDTKLMNYRIASKQPPSSILKTLKLKSQTEIFNKLSASTEKHHQFLYLTLTELLSYCSWLLSDLGINAADLDNAICLGFGWEKGPLAMWQEAGYEQIKNLINKNISANLHNIAEPLPDYINDYNAFFIEESALNPMISAYQNARFSGANKKSSFKRTPTATNHKLNVLEETASSKIMTHNDDVLIFSLKTKLATIDKNALDDLNKAIDMAEDKNLPLVIWHQDEKNFGAGANLKVIGASYMLGGKSAIKGIITHFQNTVMRLKYSSIPTVAAVQGLCLGGSSEIMLHTNHRIVAFNSYIGLVEAGVGLIPGAGGSKEMAIRALKSNNPKETLTRNFMTIATGQLATSADAALDLGFLDQSDTIIANPNELLYISTAYARALSTCYKPPLMSKIKVPGEAQIANFQFEMTNLYEGGFASEHDILIASKLANVMCGGNISINQEVSEQYLLDLEKERFMELLGTWKTKQRIAHMLKTGKRLAN